MSTKNQKRKAGVSVVESENDGETSSVVIEKGTTVEPGISVNESAPLFDFTLQNLRTSLRKELTEEVKTILAQTQIELTMAIRCSSLENRICLDEEVLETPVRSTITPPRTIRFENDKNTDTLCIRNSPIV